MRIGLRLHDSVKLPLEDRLKVVGSQGFKCVHVALSKIFDEKQYSAASALTPGYAMYLKKQFADNNLDVAVLGCYLNLAHPDRTRIREIQQKYEANIRFASVLGCGVVGTETGAPNPEYRYEEACRSKEALDYFIENLKPVVEYAERMGVLLAIEPVRKHIVYSPERARAVLDRIASPNLRIILDPVNLLDIDNYEKADDVIKEAIELLNAEIDVVHIKDFVVEKDSLISVGAGKGMMNYDRIMSFIAKQKPFIHVTLENTTPETAIWSREYIENIYRGFI